MFDLSIYDAPKITSGLLQRRDLSVEELAAVAELRGGVNFSSPISVNPELEFEIDGSIRVLAPLTLTKACTECHEGAVGDLVGAFAYTLLPQDRPKAEQDAAPNARPPSARN